MFERDWVTLDFDGSAIRFLLVQRGAASRWDQITFPPEVMSQGVVADPASAGAALKDLLQRHEVGRARMRASVGGHRAISRQLTLPPMHDRLLAEAIRHKVRQDFPLPIEQTDLTWHVLERSPTGVEVYVLAVPRAAVDSLVESVKAAGRTLNSLDLRPLALARLVHPASALLVNLEEHSLTILVVREGVPAVVRSLPFTTLRPGPEARFETLLQEMARTLKFYNEGNRESPLEDAVPLMATGELLQRTDFLETLRSHHAGPVEVPPAPLQHPADLPRATYAVNLGLAAKRA